MLYSTNKWNSPIKTHNYYTLYLSLKYLNIPFSSTLESAREYIRKEYKSILQKLVALPLPILKTSLEFCGS